MSNKRLLNCRFHYLSYAYHRAHVLKPKPFFINTLLSYTFFSFLVISRVLQNNFGIILKCKLRALKLLRCETSDIFFSVNQTEHDY